VILVAGGSGRLGGAVVERLHADGFALRVLARRPERAALPAGVERVTGDVRDPASLPAAVAGATTVVAAFHGFGADGGDPASVDAGGNASLCRAARAAGVRRYVLVSVVGAAPDHPLDLHRMKHRAEREVLASGLEAVVVRATAFMETWLEIVGAPLARSGRLLVLGRGRNPINFVAAGDVADIVAEAAIAPAPPRLIEVGGPEDLTMHEVAATLAAARGISPALRRVPRPALRAGAAALRLTSPANARRIQAAVAMDTRDMRFGDPQADRRLTLAAVARGQPLDRREARRSERRRLTGPSSLENRMSDSSHDPGAIPRRIAAAICAHDLDGLCELFAADVQSEQPAHPGRAFRGRGQIAENWGRLFAAVPDLRATVVRQATTGDVAWAEWEWRGTRGDGSPFAMVGATVMGVASGRVAWLRLFMEPVDTGRETIAAAVDSLVRPS
jgi:NADH dehydrogenase